MITCQNPVSNIQMVCKPVERHLRVALDGAAQESSAHANCGGDNVPWVHSSRATEDE